MPKAKMRKSDEEVIKNLGIKIYYSGHQIKDFKVINIADKDRTLSKKRIQENMEMDR